MERHAHGETRETRAWTPHENLRDLWSTHLDSRVYLSGIGKRGFLRVLRENEREETDKSQKSQNSQISQERRRGSKVE